MEGGWSGIRPGFLVRALPLYSGLCRHVAFLATQEGNTANNTRRTRLVVSRSGVVPHLRHTGHHLRHVLVTERGRDDSPGATPHFSLSEEHGAFAVQFGRSPLEVVLRKGRRAQETRGAWRNGTIMGRTLARPSPKSLLFHGTPVVRVRLGASPPASGSRSMDELCRKLTTPEMGVGPSDSIVAWCVHST